MQISFCLRIFDEPNPKPALIQKRSEIKQRNKFFLTKRKERH